METAVAELPDDVDALKAMVLALTEKTALLENQAAQDERLAAERVAISDSRAEVAEARIKAADERIATLTALVKMLERSRYGRRSERLNDEQCAFVFEEIESGVGEAIADLEAVAPGRAKRAPRPRKGFAAHLERVEQIIEPEVPEDCEGLDRLMIGEDVSERLDVTPAKFRVIVTRRPKYAYRNRDGVFRAPAPVHIIASGIPTERLLAQIAVSKYADGLPLYRQEAIYARDGVGLSRVLMAQWMGKVGFELQPLTDYVLERIRQAERVFADERSLPTLAPGSGQVKKAWLWAYARDDRPYGGTAPPMVAYRFEDSRGSACVARHMAGFTGILQVDGYSAYTKLAKASVGASDAVTLAGCWAHLRRRFYKLHISSVSRLASQTVAKMAELWKVEDEIRGRDPAARMAARQDRSAAIVADLFGLWEKELSRISGKSKLAEAIRYATSRGAALERFLIDGRVEIDSNIVERAIKNERRRSTRVAPANPRADCRWLDNLPHRSAYALELHSRHAMS